MTIPETITLDIYYNNTIPSFQKAHEAGLQAVIHKCSEGLTFTDPLYAKRKVEVTGLSMLWGAYHFGHAGSPIQQADFFLNLVGNDPNTLLCLDLERALDGHIMPLVDAEQFAARIKEKAGRLPVIYTAKWVMDIINPQGASSPLFDCPLWVASYNAVPALPQGWKTWNLWQYTNGNSGPLPHTLPGLGSNDLNVYNGTLDEMKTFWQASGPIGPGDTMQVDMMTTTATVNVRRGPSTAYPIAYALPAGTDVKMIVDNMVLANGYHWLERFTYRGLWIASEFLKKKIDPIAGSLKVGIHLSMRNQPPNVLQVLSQMSNAGRPCPCLLLLGPDEMLVGQIKQASPNTVIILRVYPGGGSGHTMSGEEYFRTYIDGDPNRKMVKYHQLDNEDTDFSQAALQARLQRMAWIEQHGYREATPTPPTGTPDLGVWSQPYMWNFLRYVRDHGHIFTTHEYFRNDGDWELFRFIRHALPLLPPDLQSNMPKMVFTEWGKQGARDIDRATWLAFLKTGQAVLQPYPWIIGACAWAIGDTGDNPPPAENWTGDNWGNKLDLLTQM